MLIRSVFGLAFDGVVMRSRGNTVAWCRTSFMTLGHPRRDALVNEHVVGPRMRGDDEVGRIGESAATPVRITFRLVVKGF